MTYFNEAIALCNASMLVRILKSNKFSSIYNENNKIKYAPPSEYNETKSINLQDCIGHTHPTQAYTSILVFRLLRLE